MLDKNPKPAPMSGKLIKSRRQNKYTRNYILSFKQKAIASLKQLYM